MGEKNVPGKAVVTEVPVPTAGSCRDRDSRFYGFLAGGAKTRLLEGLLDLGLPELLSAEGPMTAQALCTKLELHPDRGWKFLHLLAMSGLLIEQGGGRGHDDAVYSLSDDAKYFFGDDGKQGYFLRDLVDYWRRVSMLPLADVLRGMPLPEAVRWPPPDEKAAEHLETWMRLTAGGAIKALVNSSAMSGARTLLDAGGGDGTMGCALVDQYPGLRVTVFNLAASACIARRTIAGHEKAQAVTVHEGNFLKDELPAGFDRVLFSRVLTDWAPDVCVMLLEKARRALADGGRVVIVEALVDGNLDCAISWEFRYVFYDSFGRAVFKPLRVYCELLADAGLEVVRVTPMTDDTFYSVIEAAPAYPPLAKGGQGGSKP